MHVVAVAERDRYDMFVFERLAKHRWSWIYGVVRGS